MVAQTNLTLVQMSAGDIAFGTLNADNGVVAEVQLPSTYFGSVFSPKTVRLRPFHRDGFAIVPAQTRIYAMVSGPIDANGNLPLGRTSVPLNEHSVNGMSNLLHRSDDWLMVPLGVSLQQITLQLEQLIDRSVKMTTHEFLPNMTVNAAPHSRVIYITNGSLAGTFWGLKFGGWTNGQQFRYHPFEVRDYPFNSARISNFDNNGNINQNELYNEFMQGRATVQNAQYHSGHALITKSGLKQYYDSHVVDVQSIYGFNPPVLPIATRRLLPHLLGLGEIQQHVNFPALNYNNRLILPGESLFPINDVQNQPVAFGLPPGPIQPTVAELQAAQFRAVVDMIANFEI